MAMAKIKPKTPSELARMRQAGKILAEALELTKQEAHPSVMTETLDRLAEELIRSRGGVPAFKGYRGYPATICTSINEQVVHGIPGRVKLRDGDLLSVDVGVFFEGYAADGAITLEIGHCGAEARRLMEITRQALEAGLAAVRSGARVGEISRAIQQVVEPAGFSVVRELSGHGIGEELHEPPGVPNFVGPLGRKAGPVLPRGATIAIEPMVNAGTCEVRLLKDGWTYVTKDHKLSAHFEHTAAVEDDGPSVLTLP